MPGDLQLYTNACRIQAEGTLGDGGDNTNVIQARLLGASFTRDIAGIQERIGPFRTREFFDVVHQAWEIELRGNVRAGGFVRWLLSRITTSGGTERGLDVLEIAAGAANDVPPTFALQFVGIDGTTTFLGAALKRLALDFRGRRKQTYSATFVALRKSTSEGDWTTDTIEDGDILTTSQGRCSLAADLAGDPASHITTTYEGTIEITMPDLQAAAFDADGVPQGFAREGSWDITGRLLLPETDDITDAALTDEWNGEINLRSGPGEAGTVLEIEAGVIGTVDRRTAISAGWREVQLDFVSRRGPAEPVVRFLTDQPEL